MVPSTLPSDIINKLNPEQLRAKLLAIACRLGAYLEKKFFSIEVLIKIKLEIVLLYSLDAFLKKSSFSELKNIMGFMTI